MSCKSLSSTPTPLQVRRAGKEEHEDDEKQRERELQLQLVSLSPFRLPDNWLVEERPRLSSNARHVDKYYYEPGTGRRFRSLVSVQRYLSEETRDVLTTESVKSENEKTVGTRTKGSASFFKLPHDWIVEEKPRNNIKYAGVINRTYIEPGTGQRFRSLRAVERYLNGENASPAAPKPLLTSEEDGITLKALKLAVQSKHSEKPNYRKKIKVGKNSTAFMPKSSSPPAKVQWVLSGPGGFWSPILDDCSVPESVKLKWSEAFILSVQNGDINAPNC